MNVARLLTLSLLLILLLTGCSKKDSTPPKVFRACMPEPIILHPSYGVDHRFQIPSRALFEGLMRIGPDGSVGLGVAKSLALSEDRKTYLFELKDTIWTSGRRVMASDFVYAWKKAIAPDSASTVADLFYVIKNARAIKEGLLPLDTAGIEAIGPKTLKVELEHPAPYFLALLANPIFSPICEEVESIDPNWHLKGRGFVCNGPFRIKRRGVGQLILEKNPLYHDSKAVDLSEVHLQFLSDPYTALLLFERGELDWIGEPFEKIPADAIPYYLEKGELQTHPFAATQWLICNTDSSYLRSANLRKAIAYAIDRGQITEHVALGFKAAFSIAPEMLSHLSQEKKFQDLNVALAKLYLQKALEELGVTKEGLPPLELTYPPYQKELVQVIQQQLWEHIGLKVNLLCQEWTCCFQSYAKRQFEMGPITWLSFFEDAMCHLQTFWSRENASNWTGWGNENYHRLLCQAQQTIDPMQRARFLEEAEEILLDEMPVISLYSPSLRYLMNPKVRPPPITRRGEFDLKWTTVVK